MSMIELAGGSAETTDGPSTGGASPGESARGSGALTFDDTMVGLTLDDVCVVLVADRPVLVPLTAELAEQSGFTVIAVSDEALLALGIQARRPPVELIDAVPVDEPAPPVASPPGEDSLDVAPTHDAAADPVPGSWATWPTSAPLTGATKPPDQVSPTSLPDEPASAFRSLIETPVETARPINAMAASHLDWEPGALGWPYVDRRVDTLPTEVAATAIAAPRSLTSGRPVNLVEPVELVVRGEEIDDTDLIIELRDIATVSLAPVTFAVAATSLTVVSGPRGSGKTSLLRLLAGFEAPTQGSGLVGGEQLESIHPDDRAAREAISAGFIPQMPFLVPELTVAENVELPLLATDVSPAMARGMAEETLRLVGLGSVIGLPAAVLSGAEVRLAAVARALVSSPEIVFADEPFAGLSDDDSAVVLACLHDVVADGGTVIIACIDPRVRLHGVRQLLLDRGRLISDDVASATH